MRRLRPEDGTRAHRRAARYHAAQCKQGKAALHAQLRGQMTDLLVNLRNKARGTEDAEDALVERNADADSTEIEVEDEIRNLDAELERLDRQDPALGAQRAVFPNGFGEVLDPEGDEQLKVLPGLKVRLKPFTGLGMVAAIATQLDDKAASFEKALVAEAAALEAYDVAFAEEVDARRLIREQLESAYGQLRAHYKARPAMAERFFSREGSSRRPAKESKGGGASKGGTEGGGAP